MKTPRKNPLEWAVFTVSTLLVVSIIGYLLWMSFRPEPETNGLRVSLGEPAPNPDAPPSFTVPVRVHNPGGQPAADVQVEVTLERPDGEVEQSYLTLPLIPVQSTGEGVALFTGTPEGGRLTGRVIGYIQP